MLERTKADPWANIMGGEIERRIACTYDTLEGLYRPKKIQMMAMVSLLTT